MIASAISYFLYNLPVFLFVAAVLLALLPGRAPFAARLLGWLLLLPVGVTGLWSGATHVFMPDVAAAYIGWAPSPFQFEVGMADLALGFVACLSFWRGLGFKAAIIFANAIFLLGDAAGHVRQMMASGNFNPGNAGVPFYMDILCPALTLFLLWLVRNAPAPA